MACDAQGQLVLAEQPLQLGKRADVLFGQYPCCLEYGIGVGSPREGIDGQAQCLGNGFSEIDGLTVMFHHVAIIGTQFKLFFNDLRARRFEADLKWLLQLDRKSLCGCNAGLRH